MKDSITLIAFAPHDLKAEILIHKSDPSNIEIDKSMFYNVTSDFRVEFDDICQNIGTLISPKSNCEFNMVFGNHSDYVNDVRPGDYVFEYGLGICFVLNPKYEPIITGSGFDTGYYAIGTREKIMEHVQETVQQWTDMKDSDWEMLMTKIQNFLDTLESDEIKQETEGHHTLAEVDISNNYDFKYTFMSYDPNCDTVEVFTVSSKAEMKKMLDMSSNKWYDSLFRLKVGESWTDKDGAIYTRI